MHGSISDEVVKNLNKLINSQQTNKFRKAFNNLSTNHKNQYIKHVKEKPKGSSAMSGILNALEQKDALLIFNQLPQEFAFNTLDCINPPSTLFKTLLYQLDPQQKEDYRVHLKTKSTFKAKYTLREFYLNNKESVNNLSTENSNEPLVQNRDDLPAAHFSPISPAFEETVVEHTFDSRPDFSYENEPLVNKRKRAEENQLYSQIICSITGQRSQDLCFTAYNSLTECELEEICTVEPPAK